jgi:hypothetical protein
MINTKFIFFYTKFSINKIKFMRKIFIKLRQTKIIFKEIGRKKTQFLLCLLNANVEKSRVCDRRKNKKTRKSRCM